MNRLLVIGAGFSRLAGLPLGSELFSEVRACVRARYGADNWLERELDRYLMYVRECDGRQLGNDQINPEEFLGFLDAEHYLGLKGKDTWSREGNEAQLMVRTGIAEVLYRKAPPGRPLPDEYLRFAERLDGSDCIFTFNYDTLIEQALDAVGQPYRLFPYRLSGVWQNGGGVVDTSNDDEIVLLKLHGSINWFDRSYYESLAEYGSSSPTPWEPKHAVFGKSRVVEASPLCDGPRPHDDDLSNIFVVNDIAPLFHQRWWAWCPLILTPSTGKLFYSQPLREFWRGTQRGGGSSLGFGVVGYSLPTNDEYARQMLYHMIGNYQHIEPDLEYGGRRKNLLRILDHRQDDKAKGELRDRFRFADNKRTEFWWEGLSSPAIEWLFAP